MSRIVMEVDGDGVVVAYELRRPSTRLRAEGLRGPIANGLVEADGSTRIEPSGLLIADHPTDRIEIRLKVASTDRDSTYPLVRSLGGGSYVVFAPYLAVADRADLIVRSGSLSVAVPQAAAQGYVTIGATVSRRRGFDLISAEGTSSDTMVGIATDADRLLSLYRRRMGPPRPRRPTLIVDATAACGTDGGGRRRGDVGDNGVILLRIPSCPSVHDRVGLRRFLAHELFHLWNGRLAGGEGDWWLTEGGAEYASWWAAAEIWPSEWDLTARVDAAVRRCQLELGSGNLSSAGAAGPREARYPCGAILAWTVDLAARRDGRSDFLGILRAAMDRTGDYSVAAFRRTVARTAPAASPVLDAFLSSTSTERWANLATIANALGAVVAVVPPSGFAIRLAVAKALVGSACGRLRGVGEESGALYVQANPDCAVFGAKSVLESLDGLDPMRSPSDVYAAVRALCSARRVVPMTIRRNGGAVERREVPCSMDVEPVPVALHVEAWSKGRTAAAGVE